MQRVELKPKSVIAYATLPQVFPRLKRLFGGFNYLPLFMASMYKNLGLLPQTHPYLDPNNQGRFGIISLISATANELKINRKNIDKLIVFVTTLMALVIFALFGVGYLMSFFASSAHALASIIDTPSPTNDIAFELLDRVFGVPGIYNSGYSISAATFPTGFQVGLHAILEFYNSALFVLAVFVFLYYIVSIVAETTITGQLFGERFHKIWGPLRLIVALGLLIPMGAHGLNSAQYTLLYVAKWGSGVATNAWITFNGTTGVYSPFGANANTTYQGDDYSYYDVNGNLYSETPSYDGSPTYDTPGLIIHPRAPDVTNLAAYIDLIHTCVYAYKQMENIDIRPYFIKTDLGGSVSQLAFTSPGVISITDALTFYNNGDIHVYFGHKSTTDYPNMAGNVRPYCGSMVFPYRQLTIPYLQGELAWAYFANIMTPLSNDDYLAVSPIPEIQRSQAFGHKMVSHYLEGKGKNTIGAPCSLGYSYVGVGACSDKAIPLEHKAYSGSELQKTFNKDIDNTMGYLSTLSPNPFELSAADLDRGWATAGVWYNKIAEWNGDLVVAVSSTPHAVKFPEVMEKVKNYKMSSNADVSMIDAFAPIADGTGNVDLLRGNDIEIHSVLYKAFEYWSGDSATDPRGVAGKANPFEGSLATIFGLTPIMTMRDMNHVHPLAQLSAVGRNLIENAITNLALAAGASFVGGVMNEVAGGYGGAMTGLSGFFTALAFIGILIGSVLYYILPFMPFLYSFFAVSGWLKSIFEAMVGVPLWALSHLKLKGDGLLSQESVSGYYLLLEIFVRPTLILFGLVAATTVFAASVTVLNSIWDLVTDNLVGYTLEAAVVNDPLTMGYYRNGVDQFFFMVMYIIVVYLIGTSVFKLIDQIPHSVIRWINAGVKSFGDMAKDPAEGLYQYSSMATYRFAPALSDGITSASEGAGSMAGRAGLSEALRPK